MSASFSAVGRSITAFICSTVSTVVFPCDLSCCLVFIQERHPLGVHGYAVRTDALRGHDARGDRLRAAEARRAQTDGARRTGAQSDDAANHDHGAAAHATVRSIGAEALAKCQILLLLLVAGPTCTTSTNGREPGTRSTTNVHCDSPMEDSFSTSISKVDSFAFLSTRSFRDNVICCGSATQHRVKLNIINSNFTFDYQ